MLGSVDCMHWEWCNCPSAWKGMFTGRGKHPSMILEAIVSYDLWIWHAYFGMPGSCNDINVLYRSNIFERHLSGDTPPISFSVNGHTYNKGYYLVDRIYLDWPAFVKTIHNPYDVRTQHLQFRSRLEKILNELLVCSRSNGVWSVALLTVGVLNTLGT
jgi:hypothetical protein